MSLLNTLCLINESNQRAGHPADLAFGTVTKTAPLEITQNNQAAPLRSPVLILTESVVEKKIPVLQHRHHINTLGHSHSCPDGGTSTNLTDSYPTLYSLASNGADGDQTKNVVCYENGQPLPVEDGYIILNRSLAVGDKVIMLRVQNGQRFIVLSRVFE